MVQVVEAAVTAEGEGEAAVVPSVVEGAVDLTSEEVVEAVPHQVATSEVKALDTAKDPRLLSTDSKHMAKDTEVLPEAAADGKAAVEAAVDAEVRKTDRRSRTSTDVAMERAQGRIRFALSFQRTMVERCVVHRRAVCGWRRTIHRIALIPILRLLTVCIRRAPGMVPVVEAAAAVAADGEAAAENRRAE